MNNWLMQHRHALTLAIHRLASTPLTSLLAIFSLAITLSLPAGMAVGLQALRFELAGLPQQGSMTLYLHRHTSQADLDQLAHDIHSLPGLAGARFISRTEALATLTRHLGDASLARELRDNPLPDTWVLTPSQLDSSFASQWRARLAQDKAIDQIQDNGHWIERLHALYRLGLRLTILLAILLALAIVTVTGNTTRIQLVMRLPEIEVSRLIGATDQFIQRPFLYLGLVQGLLAGGIAWLILVTGILLLFPYVASVAHLYHSEIALAFPPLRQALAFCGLSGLLGMLGAWIAVRHTLLVNRLQ